MVNEFHRPPYRISTDKAELDVEAIRAFLAESYWARGIPPHLVEKSIQHSLCFGLYEENKQIGFARVITDYATFGYLGDVYLLESARGLGLGKWLMECVMGHPDLQGFRRWNLATRDAHGLYARYGFRPLENPQNYMEITVQNPYQGSGD